MELEENFRKECRVFIQIVGRNDGEWVGNDVSEWFPVNVGL